MPRTVTRRFTALALLLVLVSPPAAAGIDVGDTVHFDMTTAEGLPFSAADLRGRLVVIEFRAAWNDACTQLIPHLKELNEQYKNLGVTMISVSTDREANDARRMFSRHKMDWVMVLNAEQDSSLTAHFYGGPYGIPDAFLIGPGGEVLWKGHPGMLGAQLEDAMENNPPDADGGVARRAAGEDQGPDLDTDAGIAEAIVGALREHPPNYKELFALLETLPDEALESTAVLRHGRSVGNALRRFTDEQNEALALYREAYPKRSARLDAWVETSENAELGDDPDAPVRDIHPAILTRKLAEAKTAAASGDMFTAYDHYRWIVARAPDSAAAQTARPIVEELEADAEFMAEYESAAREAQAESGLTMARNLANADMKERAAEAYREVIKNYGDTEAARAARRELRNLR